MKIILFIKYPEKGKVKTRLAASVGEETAVVLYKKMIHEVLKNLQETNTTSPHEIILHYTGCQLSEMKSWLPNFQYSEQSAGDLGERLNHAVDLHLTQNSDNVCIIGTDCIDISLQTIAQTANLLLENDLVLGPSTDGGYYLIALKMRAPQLFQNIHWSTETVLTETLNAAKKHFFKTALLSEKTDIDTIHDLPENWETNLKANS